MLTRSVAIRYPYGVASPKKKIKKIKIKGRNASGKREDAMEFRVAQKTPREKLGQLEFNILFVVKQ